MYHNVIIQTNEIRLITDQELLHIERTMVNDSTIPLPTNFIIIAPVEQVLRGLVALSSAQLKRFFMLLELHGMEVSEDEKK